MVEARRKLAAILAADVAGYSRLMSADERTTLDTLNACRAVFTQLVTAHDGRVVDTAGDSVLAVFDSLVEAVLAAIEIQSDLSDRNAALPEARRMQFRVGINLGDVIEQGDGTIYGDGVNVAARLEGLAEPGGLVISESAHDQIEGKTDFAFTDMGEHSVKNMLRPVRAWRLAAAPKPALAQSARFSAQQTKPSIAVLPFTNMSGDSEQEHFSDGMTEDIITLLSTVPDLFVIARNSTFAYKGKSPDVREVARDLGVRYVLEGSVRKAGNRIRVTAQFIDAETGNHIWADKFDRNLDDIFAVQDEVAQGIAGALQSRLLVAEANILARNPPATLDAWGNIVKAKNKLLAFRRDDIDKAEPFARAAIEIDPDYGEAHAVLAHILAWRSYNDWTDDWYQAAKDAVMYADKALALAPNDSAVLTDVGFAYFHIGRLVKAARLLESAVALNPNAALTCAVCGSALSIVNRVEEGLALGKRAFQLSPKDPIQYLFHAFMAQNHFFAGQFEDAKAEAERALQSHPDLTYARTARAAACVRLNELDEARRELARLDDNGFGWAIDNIFRPRTEGSLWGDYTAAIREAMDRDPRI